MLIARVAGIYIEKDDIRQTVSFQQYMKRISENLVRGEHNKLYYSIDIDTDDYLSILPCIITESREQASKELRKHLQDKFIFEEPYKKYTKYISFIVGITEIKNNEFYINNVLYDPMETLYHYTYDDDGEQIEVNKCRICGKEI